MPKDFTISCEICILSQLASNMPVKSLPVSAVFTIENRETRVTPNAYYYL
jgi:hypothetical protein